MKKISTLLLFSFISLFLHSQCVEGDCDNGYGIKKIGEDSYSGFFQNSLFHGIGLYSFSNGDSYYGEWVNGLKQGFGLNIWNGGAHYFGNYVNETRKGKGIFINAENSYSAGIWDNEIIESSSPVSPDNNPDSCEGNCMNGLGFKVHNGTYYAGIWENGQIGLGKSYNDNFMKMGTYKNYILEGVGYERNKDGTYVGHYKNGLKNGQGSLWMNNGNIRAGIWKKDILIESHSGESMQSIIQNQLKSFCDELYKLSKLNSSDIEKLKGNTDDSIAEELEKKFLEKYKMTMFDVFITPSITMYFPFAEASGNYAYFEIMQYLMDDCGCTTTHSKETFKKYNYGTTKLILSMEDTSTLLKMSYEDLISRCLEGDCRDGEGIRYYDDGFYAGGFESYKKHGKGIFNYYDGWKKEGNWIKGELQGHALCYKNDTLRYDGEVLDTDMMHGTGKYYYVNGTYEGEFKDDFRHGYGVYTFLDGSYYKGSWEKGNEHGEGEVYYAQYENRYKGEFTNGLMEGYGTYFFKNGDKFVGNFKNGAQHGDGTYYENGGNRYSCSWVDGKQEGNGTYYYSDGSSKSIQFKNGELVD